MRRTRWLLVLFSCGLFPISLPSCAESSSAEDIGVHADFAGDLSVDDLGANFDQHSGGDLPGSCDLGVPPDGGGPERLFVAATTTGGAPYAALRASGSWGAVPTSGGGLLALVAAEFADRPMIVGRQTDDGLGAALYDPCLALLPSPSMLFALAFTAERPAVVGGSRVDVVFRGSISGDQRLYATHYDGAWQPALTLGNFLSTLPMAALRSGSDIHTVFTGTDGTIYDGVVNGSGGAATPIAAAGSNRGPAAVIDSDGTMYVVWKASDTNLVWSARPAGGAFSSAKGLCDGQGACLIASDELPVLSLDRSGAPVAAWLGKGDGLVYTARLAVGGAIWSAALAASTEATALPPALAPGLSDAELELVYVRASDGQGRHARKIAGSFSASDLPPGAIGSRPTMVRIGQ